MRFTMKNQEHLASNDTSHFIWRWTGIIKGSSGEDRGWGWEYAKLGSSEGN